MTANERAYQTILSQIAELDKQIADLNHQRDMNKINMNSNYGLSVALMMGEDESRQKQTTQRLFETLVKDQTIRTQYRKAVEKREKLQTLIYAYLHGKDITLTRLSLD